MIFRHLGANLAEHIKQCMIIILNILNVPILLKYKNIL